MTVANSNSLDITIQGKDYRVSCAPEEREALHAAVKLLDERMAEVADKTRSNGEKLAVMVALNLAHDLLRANALAAPAPVVENEAGHVDAGALRRRIAGIEAKLDKALAETKQEDLF